MTDKFRSRKPYYPDSSDYNTNAPSYYDDLARKSKLIQLLSERIWEYDEKLAKRFDAWDKNLEDFPEDVESLLQDWLSDGTLDHIINETIFNMKADQSELEETNVQLEQTESKTNQLGKTFRPKLSRSMYWADPNTGAVSLSLKKGQIDTAHENKIEGLVIPILFDYDGSNWVIINDFTTDKQAIDYALSLGMSVQSLKIHLPGGVFKSTIENRGQTTFINDYKTLLTQTINEYVGYDIPYFTVINEQTDLCSDSDYESFINDCLNMAKQNGYKAGISNAGIEPYYSNIKSIMLNSDFIACNIYTRISNKRQNTTLQDSLNAWEKVKTFFSTAQAEYRGKEIILSETGILPYYEALQIPSQTSFSGVESNHAYDLYYYGMFEKMNDVVDEVWLWFSTPNVKMTEYYLERGEYNGNIADIFSE